MPTLLFCKAIPTTTLAAGVPQDVDIETNGAPDWCIVVKNTGGVNDVTALTVARSPLGNLFGPATAAPSGIPLAPGATLEVRGEREPLTKVRLTLTSTSGTTVRIEGGGR